MESGDAVAAVTVATGVAAPLIAKLSTLMGDDSSGLIHEGVREDMLLLKDELSSINAFLVVLAARTRQESEIGNMRRRKLREMTFDMEDSIDLIRAGGFVPKSARARCLQMLRLPAKQNPGYQMATLLREMKHRIEDINRRFERYMVNEMASSSIAVDSRWSALYRDLNSLVGIGSMSDELIARLVDGGGQLKVRSIVGLAGLGKTTLANLVYRTLGEQFDCRAFVTVSQDPSIKQILLGMLSQVSAMEENYSRSEWDVSLLIHTLREFLSGKRYFVVIDDLWSTLTWRAIKCALPQNDLGSRILTTTRIISVAKSCCHPDGDHVYEMKPLADEDARRLIFTRAFGNEDSCPSELEEVSADILKKCGGLPLAITSISSSPDIKRPIHEWYHVLNSNLLGLLRSREFEQLRSVFHFSYIELSLQLRTCLLYLTTFPESYVIYRDRLIKRWMAEGFIPAKRGQSLQKLGEWYFSELINRNMIQPVGTQSNNQADACQVHSIIYFLIKSISTEEKFVISYAGNRRQELELSGNECRLSVDNRGQQGSMPPLGVTTYKVRSLTVFGSVSGMPPLSDFGALRVLDLETDGELESHYLDNIAGLLHLKYLRLQTTTIVELKEIGKLQCLETLDLTRTPISVLPANIVQLKRLKHLLVNSVILPEGIGNMQCLCELSRVKVDSSNSIHSLKELGSLTKLRVLGLNWCINDTDDQMEAYVDSIVSSLNTLSRSNLQSLCIASNDGCSVDFLLDTWSPPPFLQEFQMNTKYCLPRIPEWMVSHSNLAFLDINIDSVEQEVLQILGALPALLVLLLSSKKSPSSEQGLHIDSNKFYCLQRFDFTCWNSWGVVMLEPGAMPQLKKLELVFSAQGQSSCDGSGFGIEHLSSLKHLCVKINIRGAEALEVEAAEAAIQRAANHLPYHPTLEVKRWNGEHMEEDAEHERLEEVTSTF